jgi:hypothetical protein
MKNRRAFAIMTAIITLTGIVILITNHPTYQKNVSLDAITTAPQKALNDAPQITTVDCRANFRVHVNPHSVKISLSLANSSAGDLALMPSFLYADINPSLRTYYPDEIAPFIMELIIDTMPPKGPLQHTTFTKKLSDQPTQLILIPDGKTVHVEYTKPYNNLYTRRQLNRMHVFTGTFTVPIWRIDDPILKGIIQRCLIPRAVGDRYSILYENAVGVVNGRENDGTLLKADEVESLSNRNTQAESLRLKVVDVDPTVH